MITNHPHSKDLRKGRFSEPGRIYLVTAATRQRLPLLGDWFLGRLLVHEMKRAHDNGWVESLAWVVMPDHFHWLLTLRNGTLAELMGGVKSRSAIAINRRLGREGAVWQPGYHDRGLRREEDVRDVARYIVANPLRAGIVERIGDFPLWDAMWL